MINHCYFSYINIALLIDLFKIKFIIVKYIKFLILLQMYLKN